MTFLVHKSRFTVSSVSRLALLGLMLSTSATIAHADAPVVPQAVVATIDQNAELLRAAKAGDLAAVQAALDKGADVNTQDADGKSALQLALKSVPAPAKKKKKGLFGKLGGLGGMVGNIATGGALGMISGGLGNMGGLGNLGGLASSLLGGGSLDSLIGGNNLQSLLGNPFSLGGQSGWTTALGLALKGDNDAKGSFGLEKILGGNLDGLKDGLKPSEWTNLMGAINGGDPRALSAMQNLAGGAKNANWNQFVQMAASGDEVGVGKLMADPKMADLLQTATQGLTSAAQSLPGQSGRSIVSLLLQKGADTKSAEKLAKERGLDLTELAGQATDADSAE